MRRRFDPENSALRARALRLLQSLRSPEAIWVVLSWLDAGTARAWEGPTRFAALRYLLACDDPALRCAAQQWLAALHRIDLRCEIQAKRLLRDAWVDAHGLERHRLHRLLRSC
jgi:hypothetical protein